MAQIDFHIAHFHVSSAGYELVASAIEDDRISVEVGESTEWAAYGMGSNILYTRRAQIFGIADQALLVHECTDLSSEAAAYVAQVLFRYLNKADMHVPRDISTPYKHMFRYACILVEKYKLHRPEGRGTRLEWDDYRTLRRLIQNSPEYKSIGWLERAGADGV